MRPQSRSSLADAAFLAGHTDRVTKFALPSPFLIAVRYWHEDFSREAYPTLEDFMDHLAEMLAAKPRPSPAPESTSSSSTTRP